MYTTKEFDIIARGGNIPVATQNGMYGVAVSMADPTCLALAGDQTARIIGMIEAIRIVREHEHNLEALNG